MMIKETSQPYEYYSTVMEKQVDWLWYPFIPYGKLTLLQGDPGEGKSTFIINIAAALTTGGMLPNGIKVSEPITVIYQCAEDSLQDTIKPRLVEAGADCNRVAFIVDTDQSLSMMICELSIVSKQPVQSYSYSILYKLISNRMEIFRVQRGCEA